VSVDSVKVLYIASVARSGSTLLSMVLGQIPSWFDSGELMRLWQRGLVQHHRCGCGRPIDECPIWSRIIDNAFGGVQHVPLVDMLEADRRMLRMRQLPLHVMSDRVRSSRIMRHGAYIRALRALYQGIAASTSSTVIVDSSKHPVYGAVLRSIPALEVYVLHLIRSPLGVTYSRSQVKINPASGETMGGVNPIVSGCAWSLVNAAIERMLDKPARYMQLRYEQFVADPLGSLNQIADFVGEKRALLDDVQLDGRHIALEPTHSASGNPMRFNSGLVEIRADERWKTGLTAGTASAVRVLTYPVARRYQARTSS
jgi:hypothetical protein